MEPADRFELSSTWRGRKEAERLVKEHARLPGGMAVPKEMRERFQEQIYGGLIRQLRSIPVGLRVDAWLHTDFPALADQQRELTNRQLRDNLAVLGSDIRRLTPAKVYEASVTMNAAFAAFWARLWNDPLTLTPYRATGFLAGGEGLLKVFDDVPTDPAQDRGLIDAWGKRLGLEGWYEFTPLPA